MKIHLTCGVQTNVVTAVESTSRPAGDSPYFKQLVDATAKNFEMRAPMSGLDQNSLTQTA